MAALLPTALLFADFNPGNPPEPGVRTLTASPLPAEGGSVSPTLLQAEAGKAVSVSAYSNSGYRFICWLDEQGDTLSKTSRLDMTMPERDMHVRASFRYDPSAPAEPSVPVKYAQVTTTVNPSIAGSVSGAGKYAVGQAITLHTYSNAGYRFVNWTNGEEIVGESASLSYTVKEGDNRLTANYVYDPSAPSEPSTPDHIYTLTLKGATNGLGDLYPQPGTRYAAGQAVTVTAYCQEGYRFTGWTNEEGEMVSAASSFDYTMPASNSTLYAHAVYDPTNPSDPAPSPARRNIVYGSRENVIPGESLVYTVSLENADQVTGLNVDLAIPDGFAFKMEEATLSGRCNGHSLSMESIGTGKWRLMVRGTEPFVGANGPVIRIPVSTPAGSKIGTSSIISMDKGVVFLADGSQDPAGASDGHIRFIEGPESEILSPDFVASDLYSTASLLMPGDELVLSWKVTNRGNLEAAGGWSEAIFLIDSEGRRSTLGTLHFDAENYAPGRSESRSATFRLSDLPGISGTLHPGVTIIPNATSGELDKFQANNTTVAENITLSLGKRLNVEAPAVLTEGTDRMARVKVSRSGSWAASQEFLVEELSGDARIKVPSSVVIPKNQAAAEFILEFADNDVPDSNTKGRLRIYGNDYDAVEKEISLADNDFHALSIEMENDEVEEGASETVVISLPIAAPSDMEIHLSCDNPSRVTMPEKVTIRKGEKEVSFTVTATENEKVEGETSVLIRAHAEGFSSADLIMVIVDNDVPALSLELSPATVGEDAGYNAVRAFLRRTSNLDKRVTVDLSDNLPGTLNYASKRVVMEPGTAEAVISIGVNDNNLVDGDRDVVVSAAVFLSSCSCAAVGKGAGIATDTLHIIDNDGPALTLRSSASTLTEGDQRGITIRVERNTDTTLPMAVTLSSNADEAVVYDHTVTIPAGQSYVYVTVIAPANETTGDDRTIVFEATAADCAKGTCWVMLTDRTLPDATVATVSIPETPLTAGEDMAVSVTVENNGASVLPASFPITFYIRGEKAGSAIIPYDLAPGERCVVKKTLNLPEVPGKARLEVRLNENRTVQELLYTNNTYPVEGLDLLSPYTVSVASGKDIYADGEEILLKGKVDGKFTPGDEIEVYILNAGVRETLKTNIGDNGEFSVSFTPYEKQNGYFEAGACFPGEASETVMTAFDVARLATGKTLYTEMLTGIQKKTSLIVTNNCSVSMEGIKASIEELPEGISAKVECPETLAPGESGSIEFTFDPTLPSAERKWYPFVLNISGDKGLATSIKSFLFVQNPHGEIKVDKNSVTANFPAGKETEYPIHITNVGQGATGEITLNLPQWMKSAMPSTLPSMEAGEERDLILVLKVSEGMNLNYPLSGEIGINCSNGEGAGVKYVFTPVSEDKGSLKIRVCDEYTYYTEEAPLVAGAQVKISNPSTGKEVVSGVSSSEGLYLAELNAGYYRIDVASPKHEGCSKVVFVSPGEENVVTANISYNPIEIKWEVEETEVEDEYEIKTVVTYETNVPMPVVKVEIPESIDGDNMAVGEATMINMTLTNVGLIAAQNVRLIMPEQSSEWLFEPLDYTSPFTLAAHASVVVPVRITRLPDVEYDNPSNKVKRKDFAHEMYSTFNNCMGYLGTYYEVLCGDNIRTNQAVEKMALKFCAAAATIGAIASLIPSTDSWGPGWSGGGGYGGGHGGGGDPEIVIDLCDPCDMERVGNAMDTLIGFTWLDTPNSMLDALADATIDGDVDKAPGIYLKGMWDDFIEGKRLERRFGDWADLVSTANDIRDLTADCEANQPEPTFPDLEFDPTDPFDPKTPLGLNPLDYWYIYNEYFGARAAGSLAVSKRGWVDKFRNVGLTMREQLLRADAILLYCFGDRVWYKNTDSERFDFITYALSTDADNLPSEAEIRAQLPASVTYQQGLALIRHIHGITENPVSSEIASELIKGYKKVEEAARGFGFKNSTDLFAAEYAAYLEEIKNLKNSSVCATISLGISQTMAMTRQAFRGTLTVFNGHDSKPMKDFKLNLIVRDEFGMTATSREFQINAESLAGFSGETDIDAAWQLEGGETGTATILFIPSKYAAPDKDREYSFGGTVTYIDPYTDLEVTRTLFPVSLTVSPSPVLDLTYFMQRDVYADDPLTPDVIEPSEDAEFALVIANRGAGKASDVRFRTEQPEILENEKGLLIDFELVSSQLNGSEKALSLGGTIYNEFGDIPAGKAAYAQWWLRSSLLGHFTDYNVEATHLTSYGNPDLSLLGEVEIHELVHGMTLTDEEGVALRGFLANDIPDSKDAPDRLYFSDGRDAVAVSSALGIDCRSVSSTEYEVKVVPSGKGWTYGSTSDPTRGRMRLVSVIRKRDGAIMPLDNFWQTSVTLADGKEPVHESRLHLAAEADDTEAFTLIFEERPESVLEVVDFIGIDPEKQLVAEQVKNLDVVFNKEIDAATFSGEDIRLTLRGVRLNTQEVTVTPVSATTYRLGLGDLALANGYYVLTVATKDITDSQGFQGENGASLSWLYFPDGKVTLTVEATPAEGGSVNRKSERLDYGSQVMLEATPAEGYEFTGWERNGEFHTSLPSFTHTLNDDEIFTARFAPNSSTGIDDVEAGWFAASPLPLEKELRVSGSFGMADEISLVDAQGRILGSWKDVYADSVIELPDLPDGVYIIYVTVGEKRMLIKTVRGTK